MMAGQRAITLSCRVILSLYFVSAFGKEIYVSYDSISKQFSIHDKETETFVAKARFEDTIQENGWSLLEIKTQETYTDDVQAYAAGLAEGYLTRDLISDHWANTVQGYCEEPLTPYCRRLKDFLDTHFKWINMKIQEERNNPYWHQVELILIQVNAMGNGYNNIIAEPSTEVDPFGLMFLQIQDDVDDLEFVLHRDSHRRILGLGKCSALIKLLPDQSDLLVAHDTWSGYETMLRVLKKFDLAFHKSSENGAIPGKSIAFSSYPGTVSSTDDFYILSSGLIAMETTIDNDNPDLWKFVKPVGQVFESVRTLVANRLATSAITWAETFQLYNSGTYNNEWMIVDYTKFKPGLPLPDEGLLVVLEQLPGYVEFKDMTNALKQRSYWASYNLPFFPAVYNMSGKPELKEKYGDLFSYELSPRAQIFRRDHVKVTDTISMIRLMRYNDFKNDPLSRCNCTPPYSGLNSISARGDLNPVNGSYPLRALGHWVGGGLDMKMTSYGLQKNREFTAISGPTYQQQPAFRWSTSGFGNISHRGQPDLFKFDPLQVKWTL